MENRIVLNRHDLERWRPVPSVRTMACAGARQLLLEPEEEIDRALLAGDRL
jgi:hypothetical protein